MLLLSLVVIPHQPGSQAVLNTSGVGRSFQDANLPEPTKSKQTHADVQTGTTVRFVDGQHNSMAFMEDTDHDVDVFPPPSHSSQEIFNEQRTEPRPRKSRFKGFMAALMYCTFSASMAFANKAILSFYHFNFSYFLMFCQMMFTVFALEVMRSLGVIKLPRYTMERGRTLLIPSMLYAIYSVLALSSLARMNIAMYDVIKRCGPLATLLVSWLVLKTDKPNTTVSTSVIMITIGCIVAGESP